MNVSETRVFDGTWLRATLFNPKARHLFVTFRQRVPEPDVFVTLEPVQTMIRRGFAQLHLQSRRNDWFINSETADLDRAFSALRARYDSARAIGFSMGGYGVLRFARGLRLDRAALISPQVSIHPDVVPWDRRYRDCASGFDPALGDLSARSCQDLTGVLAFDPFRRADYLNARAISALFPGLELCALAGGGHPATQVIRLGGSYGRILTRLSEDRLHRRWMVQEHRRLRSDSALYWARLEKKARQRGRQTLAREAGRVAARLAALDTGAGAAEGA